MTSRKTKLTATDLFGFDPANHGYRSGGLRTIASPNRRFKIIFGPGLEYAMLRYLHSVALVDGNQPAPAFHALQAPFQFACWSPDSKVVAIPLAAPSDALLLYRPANATYALINANAQQLKPKLHRDRLELKTDLHEFRAYFGHKFAPPRPTVFKFKELVWKKAQKSGISLNSAALRRAPKPKWIPPPSKALLAFAKQNGIEISY